MSNQRQERLLVLEPCLRLCKQLQGTHILQYRRLDALDSWHVSGSPDIEIWIPRGTLVHIIMAEAKKPQGGVYSRSQLEYQAKYNPYDNVTYIGITDVKQLKELIITTSTYGTERLQEFMEDTI